MGKKFIQALPLDVRAAKFIENDYVPERYISYINDLRKLITQYQVMSIEMLQEATSTWKHKPDFIITNKGSIRSNRFESQINTKSLRFQMVDGGTKERWVMLSDDWVSKTSVKDPLHPIVGSGHVIHYKDYMVKHDYSPGVIDARNFYRAVQKIIEPGFLESAERLIIKL